MVGSAARVIAGTVARLLSRDVPDRTLLLGMAIAIPGAALALSAGNGNAMAVSSPWALTLGVALVVLANIAWTLYSAFARQWLPTWPSRSEERRGGKSVSVRVDLGGRRIIKKKKTATRQTSSPYI